MSLTFDPNVSINSASSVGSAESASSTRSVQSMKEPATKIETEMRKTEKASVSQAHTRSDSVVTLKEMPAFKRFSSSDSLRVLKELNANLSSAVKKENGIKFGNSFFETVKNKFLDFIGLFSKSVKESQNKALNDELGKMKACFKDNSELYENVLLKTLNDPAVKSDTKEKLYDLFDDDTAFQMKLLGESKYGSPKFLSKVPQTLKNHAQEIKEGKMPTTDKNVLSDEAFCSGFLKNAADEQVKEFIKDFCSLNKDLADKELQKADLNQPNTVYEGKTEQLKKYFLDSSDTTPVPNFAGFQFLMDLQRGYELNINADGKLLFSEKGNSSLSQTEFLKNIKEAIKNETDETKEKIADFLINTPSQGLAMLPLNADRGILSISANKDTKLKLVFKLDITGGSNETKLNIDGTCESSLGRAGAALFSDPENINNSIRGREIGDKLNQKVGFRFQFGWNRLLVNNEGRMNKANVTKFEQTIQ